MQLIAIFFFKKFLLRICSRRKLLYFQVDTDFFFAIIWSNDIGLSNITYTLDCTIKNKLHFSLDAVEKP
jgi:hypothetical protein